MGLYRMCIVRALNFYFISIYLVFLVRFGLGVPIG